MDILVNKADVAAAIKKCYNECYKVAKNTGADYWNCNVLKVLNNAAKVKEVDLNNEYIINADVNGALNIMRKEVGDDCFPADIGFVFNPCCINF